MKTNARKLLSLILSFLMVFGSVAALLPTTVMAAEEDATTNFKVFTAYDLAEAVNPDKSVNLTASINYDENGDAYLRVKPKNADAGQNHLALDFGETVGKYGYIQVEYETNVPASGTVAQLISYHTDEYQYKGGTTRTLSFDGVYTSNIIFKTASLTADWFQWYKFCPWGANQTLTDYLDKDPGTEKPALDEAYYDIKYIAFFYSQADANGFDYDTYFEETNKRTITVVVGDEEITIETSRGSTVNLLDETGLPYTNEDGDFLTFVDETGAVFGANYLVTDDVTLTATMQKVYAFFTAEDINNASLEDGFNDYFTKSYDAETERVNLVAKNVGSNRFVLRFEELSITSDTVAVVDYVTSTTPTNTYRAFMQYVTSPTSYDKTASVYPEVSDYTTTANGDYHIKAIFEMNAAVDKVYGYRFAPWSGYGDSTGNYIIAGETYCNIKYMATFDSEKIAAAFDYDAYKNSLENSCYVTLIDEDGVEKESVFVPKGDTFVFPEHLVTGANKTFAGWKTADGIIYKAGDEIIVEEDLFFTAVVEESITVTLIAEDGETELLSKVYIKGETITLSEEVEGISYKDGDGKFLVWVDENGDIYGDTIEITEEITLTAERRNVYGYYSSMDLATASNYVALANLEIKGLIKADGNYYTDYRHTNVNGHVFSLKVVEGIPVNENSVTVVDFVTSADPNKLGSKTDYGSAKMQFLKENLTDIAAEGNRKDLYKLTENAYTNLVDGLYCVRGYFPWSEAFNALGEDTLDTVYGYRFLPYTGFWSLKDTDVLRIKYIATFESAAVADAFDCNKYNADVFERQYTVKFLDKYGDPVGDEETYDFCEEIILPEADELSGHTFEGWYSVADEKLIEDDRDIVFRDNTYIARYTRDTLVLTAKDIADNSLASVDSKSNLSYNGLVSSTDANGYSSQYVRFVVKADAIDGTTTSTNDDLALIDFEKYNIVYGNKLRDTENDYNCVRIGYKTNIDSYNDIINSRNYIGGGAYTALIKNTEGQVTGQDTKFYFSVSNTSSNEIKYHIEKFKELAYGTGYDEDGNFVTTTTADMKPYVEKFGFLPYGDSSKGASELSSDHYFDIEYIAFFATKEEAEAFDYADYSADLITSVKLVALIGRDAKGYFTVGDSDEPETNRPLFVPANKAITLTAVPDDGYAPAYWVRFTQDDTLTQVLLATGATVEAYPLGGSVYYQPVFKAIGETVSLYIDKATREIIPADEVANYDPVENAKFSTDDVKVYDCTKKEEVEHNNPFIVYELGSETPVEIPEEFANPAFGDSVVINKSDENTAPKWTVELGEKVYTASYENSFLFSYMFEAGTEVVVRENQLGDKAATPAISTVATWTEGNITRFTGLFALPNGYELINHGVMMSQDYEHLEALEDNETGELNVTPTTIVGRVSNNGEDAAPLFTIAKRLSLGTETWYGRAFLVYTDDETTYVVYANDILSSGIEPSEVEADYDYNPEVYNPMYWDDTIPVPAV